MAKKDLTQQIERLEAFEDRVGVRLQSLSAFLDLRSGGEAFLTIHGELHASDGTELRSNITLVAAAYDDQDRVVGTSDKWFDKDDFFGLDIFDFTLTVESKALRKVRIFPKRRD